MDPSAVQDSGASNAIQGEADFRRFFEHFKDALLIIDPAKDRIIDANAQACSLLDYRHAELLALPISALYPDGGPRFSRFIQSVISKGSGWTDMLSFLTLAGKNLPVELSASALTLDEQQYLLVQIQTRDPRERASMAGALRSIVEGTAKVTGTEFFRSLVKELAVALEVRYALVAEFLGSKTRARTLAFWNNGKFGDNFEYQLTGTPCEIVAAGQTVYHTSNVYQLFPQDTDLVKLGIESYFGVPLCTEAGDGLGHLAVFHDRSVEAFRGMAILNIFAARAGAELRQLRNLTHYLEQALAQEGEELIGAAGGLREVMQQVQQVAATDATVLICGETGTGKELIAQAIHRLSPRQDNPLIKLNCAALPANLIESELFGHEKGAFTGAVARKPGRFELANGGTLFLDEIGELPLDLQAKLLRVLQEGEFERVGGTRCLKVNVRILAATNRNLGQDARAGQFRADLYYRLNVFPIALPPLRERKEDILPLTFYFVQRYAVKYGKHIDKIPEASLAVLQHYLWPGNVRELQHIIERAVILSQDTQLALGDWFRDGGTGVSSSPEATLEEVERTHILKVLDETGWRVSGKGGAAERLGLKPTTLESRLKKLGIKRKA